MLEQEFGIQSEEIDITDNTINALHLNSTQTIYNYSNMKAMTKKNNAHMSSINERVCLDLNLGASNRV
jgi:hypothetical protein